MQIKANLGAYKHGNLPHMDACGAVQFITFVLADAAPSQQLPRGRHGLGYYSDNDMWGADNILDRCSGECILANRDVARIVRRSIYLKDGESHLVLAWVIMPNHVHMLIKQNGSKSLGNIMKQIKAGSAHLINEHLGRKGKVWQIGYFDRMIRTPMQLKSVTDYIHDNPVQAGLTRSSASWQMSSCSNFNPLVTAGHLRLPEDWYVTCGTNPED